MDKGVGMMMRNKVEELAPLDPFLIPFQIYEIKEVQSQDFMTLQMRRPTLQVQLVNKEVEGNGNQTIEKMTNTN